MTFYILNIVPTRSIEIFSTSLDDTGNRLGLYKSDIPFQISVKKISFPALLSAKGQVFNKESKHNMISFLKITKISIVDSIRRYVAENHMMVDDTAMYFLCIIVANEHVL